jgi:hypothetical protein
VSLICELELCSRESEIDLGDKVGRLKRVFAVLS